jgi:cytochrome c
MNKRKKKVFPKEKKKKKNLHASKCHLVASHRTQNVPIVDALSECSFHDANEKTLRSVLEAQITFVIPYNIEQNALCYLCSTLKTASNETLHSLYNYKGTKKA